MTNLKIFNIKVWGKKTRKTQTVSFEDEVNAINYILGTLKNMEGGFVPKFEVFCTEKPNS